MLLTVVLLAALSVIPGPPEQFKDWPQIDERTGICPDGRLINQKAFAKQAIYANVGAMRMEDAQGPFVWVYYTDKDVDADSQWVAVYDGEKYLMGTLAEVRAQWPGPCDIPRPLPESKAS